MKFKGLVSRIKNLRGKKISFYFNYLLLIPHNIGVSLKIIRIKLKAPARAFFFSQNGDLLCFLAYAKAYIQKNHKKIIIVSPYLSLKSVAEMFDSDDIFFVKCDIQKYKPILHLGVTLFMTQMLCKFREEYDSHFMDSFRVEMELPQDTAPFFPRIVNQCEAKMKEKTILIIPDVNSQDKYISDEEWIDVSDCLEKLGYNVIFNCRDKTRFPGFESMFCSVKDTVIFCNRISCIISCRSGLNDCAAAFSQCKQIIVYPDNPRIGKDERYIENFYLSPDKKYMDYFSVAKMFGTDATEFIYEKGKLKDTIEREIKNNELWQQS